MRLKRINDVCKRYRIDGKVRKLYTFSPRNVSYCSNHKVASTYWIQVFRFLHNDTPPGVQRPIDISKYYTHQIPLRKTKKPNFHDKVNYEETMQNYRFMVARDPYQRLWSVYIDKFVLLDPYFWNNYFELIRANFLRDFGDAKKSLLRNERANNSAPTLDFSSTSQFGKAAGLKHRPTFCKKQLSFEEFLHYIVATGESSTSAMDDHFQPVHIGCNPCIFKPDFVAKVETMNLEKGFLLERLGLSPDIDGEATYEDHVQREITTLSQFQFYLLINFGTPFSPCVTFKNLQERIITAFVLNGYLPLGSFDIISPLLPMEKDKFIDKLMQLVRISKRTAEDVHQQRENMRKEAYKKIPFQTLLSLQHIFKKDFLLFGYDSQPPYIYEDRIDFEIKKIFDNTHL
ncbi:carbohydrate sulfotransferase [Elysia marginata]|uniref:Carbohydrate sulfotransferase n=1 Tax=Elysia marginata TaxID=1093978 RepID=A0AAV4I5E3_9GAST|nr:carbohydrate sulfotransferase [Elysia marginata]